MGGGATGDFSTGEQTMNHNRAMRDNQKPPESPVTNIINAGSELNYLNNLKNLNLPGLVLGFGVNKFRNFIGNKKYSFTICEGITYIYVKYFRC